MITESVKSQVFTQLGCQSSEAKLLGGYNQHVFEVNRGGEKLVVKIEEGSAASEQDAHSRQNVSTCSSAATVVCESVVSRS